MAQPEGGRWDVGVKGGSVYIARVSDSDERVFEDQIAPEEARELAELLRKYAGKADESDAKHDEDDDDEDDDDEDDDDKDDDDKDDDDKDDDDKDDDDKD